MHVYAVFQRSHFSNGNIGLKYRGIITADCKYTAESKVNKLISKNYQNYFLIRRLRDGIIPTRVYLQLKAMLDRGLRSDHKKCIEFPKLERPRLTNIINWKEIVYESL